MSNIKKIFMKRSFMLLLVCWLINTGLVFAQTLNEATGVVISEDDGQPIAGASVLVKGTSIGSVTDMDGKFTITGIPSSSRT